MWDLSAGHQPYAGKRRVRDLEYVPFRVLDDPPILRPSEPAWSRFSLLRFVEDTYHTWRVATVGDLGYAPHSQVTIRCLGGQHLRLLLRRRSVPRQSRNRGRGARSRKSMKNSK
jgi:hypothetical protein